MNGSATPGPVTRMPFPAVPTVSDRVHHSNPNSNSFGLWGAQLGWKLGLTPSAAERPAGSSMSSPARLVVHAEAEFDGLAGVAKLLHVGNLTPRQRALNDPRAAFVADLKLPFRRTFARGLRLPRVEVFVGHTG